MIYYKDHRYCAGLVFAHIISKILLTFSRFFLFCFIQDFNDFHQSHCIFFSSFIHDFDYFSIVFILFINFFRLQMSERSILSRLASSASGGAAGSTSVTPAGQFPAGFQQGQLPGVFGVNFAQFKPQYSIPGQSSAFPGTAPPEKTEAGMHS